MSDAQPPKSALVRLDEKMRDRQAGAAMLTEQAVMRMFVELHKDRLRYNHDSKEWLIWNRHYWKRDGKQHAFAWALDLCRSLPPGTVHQKIRFSRAVEEGARAQPELATATAEWDQDAWLLGTPDGVIDLKTGRLRPGRPEDMISKVIACAPADEEDCPEWKKFITYALHEKQDNIDFFQRFAGYSITGSVEEEAILFLVGREGTGKGTATKTLLSILKDYAVTVRVRMFTDAGWRQVEYYCAKLPGNRLARHPACKLQCVGRPEFRETYGLRLFPRRRRQLSRPHTRKEPRKAVHPRP